MRYPETAAQADIEGCVIVNVVVEKNGSVSSATVKKSVHPALDKEACRVLRKARGNAKIVAGRAVRARYAVPMKFRLS